jgi:hypothetical protein
VRLALGDDNVRRDVGRRGDDHEVDAFRARVGDARADVTGECERRRGDVGEQHPGTGRRQPEADTRAEQPGADDADGPELAGGGWVEAHGAPLPGGIGGTSARSTSVPRR